MKNVKRSCWILLASALFAASCGGSDVAAPAAVADPTPADESAAAAEPTAPPAATAVPEPTATSAPTPVPEPTVGPEGSGCIDQPRGPSGRPDCVMTVLVAQDWQVLIDTEDGEAVVVQWDNLDGTFRDVTVLGETYYGSAVAFALTRGGQENELVEVEVPSRPPARVWVRADQFSWSDEDGYALVDAATKQIWVWDGDELVVDGHPVSLGKEDSPTPLTTMWVDELLLGEAGNQLAPISELGILSLSGFGEFDASFLPKMNMMGTDKPDTIGEATTGGGIRLRDDTFALAIDALGLGARIDIIDSSQS